MRKLTVLVFCLLIGSEGLMAEVILPESGRLAGPLNSAVSEFGDEFFFFPEFIGTAPPGTTPQEGWLEIDFGLRSGNVVSFEVNFHSVGPNEEIEFSGGQHYILENNQLQSLASVGLLDLDSGDVFDFAVAVFFKNSGISKLGKLNRIFNRFNHQYPPNLAGLPLPPLPPGFVFGNAAFSYDPEGRITGFALSGQGLSPAGAFGLFPGLARYSFGPNRQSYFSTPNFCNDDVPPEACPDEESNPDGLVLPTEFFLHPHVFLNTEELSEISEERSSLACAPQPRSDAVVVSKAGKIYQVGGSYTPGINVQGQLDIYDTATRTWEKGRRLRVPVVESQGAVIGDKIYLAGGRRFPRSAAVKTVQAYDITTGEWKQLARMPIPVAKAAATAFADRLYIFGGMTNRANGSPAGNLKLSDLVQIYDPASDSWEIMKAVSQDSERIQVAGASAVVNGTEIYLINGRTRRSVTNQVWIFDGLNSTFSSFFPAQPTRWGVYDASAVRIGKRIYLSGGRSEINGPSEARMQVLDLESGSWSRIHSQPVPTAASGGVVVNGEYYVLGGRAMSGSDTFPGPKTGVLQSYHTGQGWQACNSYPIFTNGDVFSMASLGPGPAGFSPGALATISGHFLADSAAVAAPGEAVPTELGGVSIQVDGEDAPILSVSPTRIDFQIPYNARSIGKADLVVSRAGSELETPAVRLSMVEAIPNVFIQNCGELRDPVMLVGASAVACQNDGTLNHAANPVLPGGLVNVQMSGLGAIDTALGNGERAPADSTIQALAMPSVKIDDVNGQLQDAAVLSATLAPGEVGIYDVQIVVPQNSRIGNRVRMTMELNGFTANESTLSIGTPVTDDPVSCVRDTNPSFRACVPVADPAAPVPAVIFLDQLQ